MVEQHLDDKIADVGFGIFCGMAFISHALPVARPAIETLVNKHEGDTHTTTRIAYGFLIGFLTTAAVYTHVAAEHSPAWLLIPAATNAMTGAYRLLSPRTTTAQNEYT